MITKGDNRRAFEHYGNKLFERMMDGRISRDKYDRCAQKLTEWYAVLRTMKRGDNV